MRVCVQETSGCRRGPTNRAGHSVSPACTTSADPAVLVLLERCDWDAQASCKSGACEGGTVKGLLSKPCSGARLNVVWRVRPRHGSGENFVKGQLRRLPLRFV